MIMEKNILDTIIKIVNDNYLFVGTEKSRWENLCMKYYAEIIADEKQHSIIDLFREMGDYHTKYIPRNGLPIVLAPLIWNKHQLYWVEQGEENTSFYVVDTLNGTKIVDLLSCYGKKYGGTAYIAEKFILEDVMSGRMCDEQGMTFQLRLKDNSCICKNIKSRGKYVKPKINESENRNLNLLIYRLIDKSILYIKLPNFYIKSDYSAIMKSITKEIEVMVFDLRDNPGGFVSNAKKSLGHFLEQSVTIEEYQATDGKEFYRYTIQPVQNGKGIHDKRIYVLMNENTMSSAEYIFILGLKQAYQCELIGQTTMGLSGQCKLFEIGEFGILSVTTKKYIKRNGDSLRPLVPDCIVDMKLEDLIAGKDTQLQYILTKEGKGFA